MWLNAFLYWILPYILLIPLVIVAALLGDSEATKVVLGIGYVLYLLAYFFLPPMYANALYYRHYKNKLGETKLASRDAQRQLGILSEKGGTSNVAIIILIIFSFIAMFGILLAIAIPAYQDYTVRAKIAEGINTASAAKLAVAEMYAESGTVPADNSEAGYMFKKDSPNVHDILIEDGIITIVMAPTPVEGGSIVLEPSKGVNDTIVWECHSPDIEKKYLPVSCR
jgi:Tfp pilus assembly major pilin PilA